MVKFRIYFDKDKEELWLNEMAGAGWAMTDFFLGFYRFEPCEPGEYIYQIDLFTENKQHMTHEEYLSIIEESGAEYVCRWFWWGFFRRRAELGDFQLYTDVDSRLEQLQRIFRFFRLGLILEAAIFCYELFVSIIDFYQSPPYGAVSGGVLFCRAVMALMVAVFGIICYRMKKKINKLKNQLI